MKEKHIHAALLGVTAIVVLLIIMRRGKTSQTNPAVASAASSDPLDQYPPYPNAQPIHMGDITIGGSPISLTYNQLPAGQENPPTVIVAPTQNPDGACPCENDACSTAAGIPVSVNKVPVKVVNNAVSNLSSYMLKTMIGGSPATGTKN
jgi:hypothetical protein